MPRRVILKEKREDDIHAKMSTKRPENHTACPRSSDPFYVVTYYIKWVTSSWTHSKLHHEMGHYFLDTQYLYRANSLEAVFDVVNKL